MTHVESMANQCHSTKIWTAADSRGIKQPTATKREGPPAKEDMSEQRPSRRHQARGPKNSRRKKKEERRKSRRTRKMGKNRTSTLQKYKKKKRNESKKKKQKKKKKKKTTASGPRCVQHARDGSTQTDLAGQPSAARPARAAAGPASWPPRPPAAPCPQGRSSALKKRTTLMEDSLMVGGQRTTFNRKRLRLKGEKSDC